MGIICIPFTRHSSMAAHEPWPLLVRTRPRRDTISIVFMCVCASSDWHMKFTLNKTIQNTPTRKKLYRIHRHVHVCDCCVCPNGGGWGSQNGRWGLTCPPTGVLGAQQRLEFYIAGLHFRMRLQWFVITTSTCCSLCSQSSRVFSVHALSHPPEGSGWLLPGPTLSS